MGTPQENSRGTVAAFGYSPDVAAAHRQPGAPVSELHGRSSTTTVMNVDAFGYYVTLVPALLLGGLFAVRYLVLAGLGFALLGRALLDLLNAPPTTPLTLPKGSRSIAFTAPDGGRCSSGDEP